MTNEEERQAKIRSALAMLEEHRKARMQLGNPAVGSPTSLTRRKPTLRQRIKGALAVIRGRAIVLQTQGVSFARAITSPRVPDDEYERRMAICLSNRCGSLRTEGEKHYCGGCRCPSWPVAELTNKLRMGGWKCPRGLFDRWSGPDGTTSTK